MAVVLGRVSGDLACRDFDTDEEYEKWKASQEPWLSKNPEYMAQVPENLKELAMIKAQTETTTLN